MAVPENIEELAHHIRTAIYGRDVRESIASGLEETADVADWSRRVAQDIIDGNFDEGELATEIENKLNQLEQDYAPTLTSIENEVENARGNESSLGDRLNSVNSQLVQIMYINPDIFEGTDIEKVQKAIDEATRNIGRDLPATIKFYRMFDITGGTLFIKHGINRRVPMYFEGSNGGLLKNDSGFMFDSGTNGMHSDLVFERMMFRSIEGSGLRMINADKLIRFHFTGCFFRNVDTILYADGYFQTMSFDKNTITGGRGDLFRFNSLYDFRFLDNTVEHVNGNIFVQNEESTHEHEYIFHAVITDNVIEGIKGTVADLSRVRLLNFENNYLEVNDHNIIMRPKIDNHCWNLNIKGNRYFNSSKVTSKVTLVEWRGFMGKKVRMEGNLVERTHVIDLSGVTGANNNTKLYMRNNHCNNLNPVDFYEGIYQLELPINIDVFPIINNNSCDPVKWLDLDFPLRKIIDYPHSTSTGDVILYMYKGDITVSIKYTQEYQVGEYFNVDMNPIVNIVDKAIILAAYFENASGQLNPPLEVASYIILNNGRIRVKTINNKATPTTENLMINIEYRTGQVIRS